MSFITSTEVQMKSAADKFHNLFNGDVDSWEYLESNELEQRLTKEELIVLTKKFNDALHAKLTK